MKVTLHQLLLLFLVGTVVYHDAAAAATLEDANNAGGVGVLTTLEHNGIGVARYCRYGGMCNNE
jgi:uncharacterized protein YdbL (DUF1318 family)